MGPKGDQDFSGDIYRPGDHSSQPLPSQHGLPPPLPPRADAPALSTPFDGPREAPPPYIEELPIYHSQPLSHSWTKQDPRSSSTQSLVPHQSSEGDGKRTLLLVYVHGFMGNETSFQSFPAHVHNLVTVKLAESHVVHTKIYPKYKSRRHIEFARDGFSEWLRPHGSPYTDIILLGHSMGGILSAEVALLEGHRIIGTINFDTPFLGMHPGVIASGLGSLFRPAPDSPVPKPAETGLESQSISKTATDEETQSSTSSSYFGTDASSTSTFMPTENNSTATLPMPSSSSLDLPVKDPNYDPPFVNDVRLPQRSGWANAWHFINKHSDGLTKATQAYVKSHLEFGGAMADYNGLKKRYEQLRALDNGKTPEGGQMEKIRFVNYYTASTGRPKKPKSVPVSGTQTDRIDGDSSKVKDCVQDLGLKAPSTRSPSLNPRISVEKVEDETPSLEVAEDTQENFPGVDEAAMSDASHTMDHMDPAPVTDDEREDEVDTADKSGILEPTHSTATSDSAPSKHPSIISTIPKPTQEVPTLPPVPAAPEEPAPFDPAPYTDKDTHKLAEKGHARQIKAYKQAMKDRDKAISDRRKFLEKREKKVAKEREKQVKAEEKERVKTEKRTMEKGERERAKLEWEELKRADKAKAQADKEALKRSEEEKPSPSEANALGTNPDSKDEPEKPKRDKKFCMLPPHLNNQIDPCWVRVFMPGVDEVGAHCGLFFVDGERYEKFVSNVAERIEVWVEESRT